MQNEAVEDELEVESTPPLEVKVIENKKYSIYDSYDDYEYDEHHITEDEIKEAQNDNTSIKET